MEPVVTINGVTLNNAQAMAFRVAISNFLADMQDPLALGDDEHGRFMTAAYRTRMQEIERMIFGKLS